MKIKSCAWLVCLILCLPITMKAQVLKIENGMAFSSLVNEGEDLFDKSLSSYQMSIGLDYLDQGWYALSSNVGYLRKGGSFDFYEATDPGLNMLKRNMKYMFDYITLNTTFRVKTLADSGFRLAGKGMGCVCHQGKRGNPAIFASAYREELMGLRGDRGGSVIMKAHPGDVWTMEVPEEELKDIDRAEDLGAVQN